MIRKRLAGRYKKGKYGVIINKKGVAFSKTEFNNFKDLTKSVNLKRKRLERKAKKYGEDFQGYFGKQVGSLHLFDSKEEFRRHVNKLKRFNSDKYVKNRDKDLFENYKDKIRQVFNDKNSSIMIRKLNKLGYENFVKSYKEGKVEDIAYLYTSNSKDLGEYDQQQLLSQLTRVTNSIG